MVFLGFPLTADALREFCERHQIRKLALFGSILRDDFSEDSDVDVLVDFEPNARIGWDVITIEDELSMLLGGRAVDLVTYQAVNPHLRDYILPTARIVYEKR